MKAFKRRTVSAVIVTVMVLLNQYTVSADDISDLQKKLESMQEEMDRKSKEIEKMQAEIKQQSLQIEAMKEKIGSMRPASVARIKEDKGKPLNLEFALTDTTTLKGLIRSYYVNDQRVDWSGQESTFEAEAAITPSIELKNDWIRGKAEGSFFINQPFAKNRLHLPGIMNTYRSDFDTDIFEIDKLFLEIEKWNFTCKFGKDETPFGRYYFPLFTNARFDAPFIRSEVILWRETGISLSCK